MTTHANHNRTNNGRVGAYDPGLSANNSLAFLVTHPALIISEQIQMQMYVRKHT